MISQIVMEAGFKVIPGQEEEFLAVQSKLVPLGASQPGFLAVYGGPIRDSAWLYFGVRFASHAQMDAWHHHPQHQAVQRQAYAKWWTAVYIRKWVTPSAANAAGERVMCETRIVTPARLSEADAGRVTHVLSQVEALGGLRFETLTGEYEPQAYQFVGPMEIFPPVDGAAYSLITHWPDKAHAEAWIASPAYQDLGSLGALLSECFVALPEAGTRERLREDRMQRQWASAGAA